VKSQENNSIPAESGKENSVISLIRAGVENLFDNHEKAIRYGQDALELSKKNSDIPGMIKSTLLLADINLKKLFNSKDARKYLNQTVTYTEEIGDQSNKIQATIMIGSSYIMEGNHTEAIKSLDEAQNMLDALDDIKMQAAIYAAYGMAYLFISEYDKSLEYNLKCLEIGEHFSNKTTLGNVHNNSATIYFNINRNEDALKHFKSALILYQETGNQQGIVRVNTNISQVYSRQRDLEKALNHAQTALRIAEKINSHHQICICLNNLGDINKEMGEIDKALNFFLETYSKAEELNLIRETASGANNLGDVLTRLGRFDEALKYLDIGLVKAKEIGDLNLEKNNYFLRAKVGEFTEDYKLAYDQICEFIVLKDKVINDESTRRIDQLKTKYDTARKERESDVYRLKNVELDEANKKLKDALESVKVLSGLVPICAHCMKIRDDKGFWNQLEKYISKHSEATFSHGICPGCMKEHYPKFSER